MKMTNDFYEVVAKNIVGDITFSIKTIDSGYAKAMYRNLCECVDVQETYIMSETTGEILEYSTEF